MFGIVCHGFRKKKKMEEGLKSYLEQLVEGLIDEDEGNKDGENFLRKT